MNERANLCAKEWLQLIWEFAKRDYPLMAKLCYPRRIVPPNGYFNPKWYSPLIYGLSRFWDEPAMCAQPHITGALAALQLIKYGVPTYFVQPEYAQAVAQTRPPEDFRLSEIQWPLDAMLFVLPDSFIRPYFGWYIPFISVARVPAGTYPNDAHLNRPSELLWAKDIGVKNNMAMFHFPLLRKSLPAVDYTGAYPLHLPLAALQEATWNDATHYEESLCPAISAWKRVDDGPQGEAERVLHRKVLTFVIRLLLALTAEPAYLVDGGIQRTEKRNQHNTVVRTELWNPNLLGWNYRTVRPETISQGGTHASPRMHWRPGHYTYQVKGKRDQLVPVRNLPRTDQGKIDWDRVDPAIIQQFWNTHKLIWLKPVLVSIKIEELKQQT